MTVLVPTNQRLTTGVKNPESSYSRIVSIHWVLPAAPGMDFGFTHPLAQKLWLRSIDFWLWGTPYLDTDSWWFTLRRGFQQPKTSLEIQQLEEMLPLCDPGGPAYWHGYSSRVHMHWDMNKLYEGLTQRFCAVANSTGPTNTYIEFSFQISEG